jgi:arylsulfatase A-like enzyme
MRADAMSCAGNPCVNTPNIDRLADGGVRFSNAYSSFPLCCPWRASLFTGKYAHSHGMVANHYLIRLDQEFLPQILSDAGYRTGYIGKWHLNGGKKHALVKPEDRLGFNHFVGFSRGHAYANSIYYKGDSDVPYTSKRFEPDYQTDHLIEFMESCVPNNEEEPFFAMICYGMPHPPLVAPENYLNMHSPDEIPINGAVPEDYRGKAAEFLAKYYGLVAHVDDNLGRVLNWLDDSGMADDTLVLFVSDHGDMAGDHGLFDKKTHYRGAMQAPMIVRYPKQFTGGRVVESIVDPSVDTMPTLLELCGAPVPDCVQGTSYLPALDGGPEPTRTEVFYEICMQKEGPEAFPVPHRGVRTLDWLYVRTEEQPIALFDEKNDPLELNNLADSQEHREVIEKLDAMLKAHMQRTGDDWRVEAIFPPPDFETHAEAHERVKLAVKQATVEP